MNNQEAFNNTWRHHVVEKNPLGYDKEKEVCTYLGPDGERCAMGCQMPDEFARAAQDLGGASIGHVFRKVREAKRLFCGADILFLKKLQNTHDCAAGKDALGLSWLTDEMLPSIPYDHEKTPHENLEIYYRILAEQFNLDIPEERNE